MKLSVIIVNYNVKHFLEQCLHSVYRAAGLIETEVFVVDNNSVDGSCHLVKEKFPEVTLISNKKNSGYSAANNQAIIRSKGEYVLLLNPDTVVEEDTFVKCISFMDAHPEAGALGVKMIDGKGRFLPESKRGMPTPWVAFYKIFGLAKLFPKSKRFGKYHLTYLNHHNTHEVEVICGAFMLLRRKTLDTTGLLDESFFMYGEDIDLSYRITRAGYKNFYFAGTTIIHYKGESTKKGSINYVKIFYQAMLIFSRKHFSGRNYRFLSLLIHLAIYFRAGLAILQRITGKVAMPLTDAAVFFLGFMLILPVWERAMFEPGYYPPLYLQWVAPAYIIIWITGIALSGGYRQPVSLLRLLRGILWGLVAILLAYSLVDEAYRFSRALIIFASAWAVVMLPGWRLLLNAIRQKGPGISIERPKRIAIAGHQQEISRVTHLLHQTPVSQVIVGYVALNGEQNKNEYLGRIDQIKEIIAINRIDEIIFCAEDMGSGEIIKVMLELSGTNVDFKIAPPESYSIIGSNSIHTAGDLYLVDVNVISKQGNRRLKRILDFMVACFLLATMPLLVWFFKRKGILLRNIISTLAGGTSWVGFIPSGMWQGSLPLLKPGVLNPADLYPEPIADTGQLNQMNMLYAKNYRPMNDIEIILQNWRKLDRPATKKTLENG